VLQAMCWVQARGALSSHNALRTLRLYVTFQQKRPQ